MTSMADRLLFASLWMRQPFRIAAASPSGQALATLITASIEPDEGPVVELGAGTGVFTRTLLDRGVREKDLLLIESNPLLAQVLGRRFPAAHVVVADAAALASHYPFGSCRAGAVISGLPLLSIPQPRVVDILSAAFGVLHQGGALFQFTYGYRCPVHDDVLDWNQWSAERVGWVLANLPPATVYRFQQSVRRPKCDHPSQSFPSL